MLWLARPAIFNDAFELRPHFEYYRVEPMAIPEDADPIQKAVSAFVNNQMLVRSRQPAAKELHIDLHTTTIVVLSLAETCDSLRMWAHYGDAHRGYALGFDTDVPILEWSQQQRLQKIAYSKRRPSRETFDDITNDDLLFTKSDEWKYEQEWRLVESRINATDDGVKERGRKGNPAHYSFRFNSESLREVIVGCRSSLAKTRRIRKLVSEKYSRVNMRYARKHPSEYKIEIL